MKMELKLRFYHQRLTKGKVTNHSLTKAFKNTGLTVH